MPADRKREELTSKGEQMDKWPQEEIQAFKEALKFVKRLEEPLEGRDKLIRDYPVSFYFAGSCVPRVNSHPF